MKKYLIILSITFFGIVSSVGAQGASFLNDLSLGVTGNDVVTLQSWLISNGYDIPAIRSGMANKGYFGAQTKVAVMKYQADNGVPTTGFVGPMTRAKLNYHKPTDSRAPVINGIDAPTILNVNQTGTWTVRATDPQNGTLSYSVDWGDMPSAQVTCPADYSCQLIGAPASIQQGSTFTHSYSNVGTHTVWFTVKNSAGLVTKSSVTVVVGNTNASPLRIISPNGGEDWQKGNTQNITWTSPAYFRATYADIKLVEYQYCPDNAMCKFRPALTYMIARNISINQNSHSWKVGNYSPEVMIAIYPTPEYVVPDGQYTVQICEGGTNNCDSSDRPFTISSSVTNNPKVTSPNGGEVWQSNSVRQISWAIEGLAYTNSPLDLYLDQANIYCITAPCGNTYVLDKNVMASTIYNWIVATDVNNVIIPPADYRVRICLAGSTTDCDSSDNYFTITQ